MDEKVKRVIEEIKESARHVYKELGSNWSEGIYQKAMEIELKERGIVFESQRILPVFFKDSVKNREYCVGEGIPDFIVWVEKGKRRIGIVIDLKAVKEFTAEHVRQVQKYMEALSRELKENEEIYKEGMVINFGGEPKSAIPPEILDVKENFLEIIRFEKDEDIGKKIKEYKEKKQKEKKKKGG